jgi:hypothetical protein
MNLAYILTGGFLKGYRTYILAGLGIAGLLANYLIGDADLAATVTGIVTAVGTLTAAKHDA